MAARALLRQIQPFNPQSPARCRVSGVACEIVHVNEGDIDDEFFSASHLCIANEHFHPQ